MNIFFCSDIHLESRGAQPVAVPEAADVAIFAGDIHVGMHAIEFIRDTANVHPDKQIIFVAGNHEYHDHSIQEFNGWARKHLDPVENAHFLERGHVSIDGISFLGATLWTGFDILPNVELSVAKSRAGLLEDFRSIRMNHTRLKTSDAEIMYRDTRLWLQDELPNHDPAKTVVITHFPPCMDVRHPGVKNHKFTPYFQANCGDIIDRYEPAYWIYGHNHYNHELHRGKTCLVSNQRGYRLENVGIGYSSERMIEL